MARPIKQFSDYYEDFKKIHGDKYTYNESTYKNSVTKMEIICPIHGSFWQKPNNHKNGKGCIDCGLESMRKKLTYPTETITSLLENKHDYEIDSDTYKGTKNPMKFVCNLHGEFWQKPMNQLRQDAGCPKCSTTKAEKELLELYPNLKHRDRNIIQPLEIDLLDTSNKFGIEFNGIIWHSYGKTFPNNIDNLDKNKHLVKTQLMEEKGYQLFHINELDWLDPLKNKIWKSVLNSKINRTNRIFARKTIIKDISKDKHIVDNFLENNHLQGKLNYKYAFGLYFEDKLVSLMTFGLSRYDSKIEFELLRFCNLINTTVIGGASKLLRFFEKNFNPKSLVSYAKRDWSQGNLYIKLGFEFLHNSDPSFYYYRDGKLYSRIKFQKHKLKELYEKNILKTLDGNTAKDIMLNNGYRIYYDTGNKVFKKYY